MYASALTRSHRPCNSCLLPTGCCLLLLYTCASHVIHKRYFLLNKKKFFFWTYGLKFCFCMGTVKVILFIRRYMVSVFAQVKYLGLILVTKLRWGANLAASVRKAACAALVSDQGSCAESTTQSSNPISNTVLSLDRRHNVELLD